MMRRGTLADHRVATVLRQAAAERLGGQIDIDGDRPAVVYLADGELALACWADEEVEIAVDDEADDATYASAILTEERRLRAASRDVLGLVLDRDDGWYHHHPLGEHRAAALWSWPVEEVLAEVAVRAHRPTSEDQPAEPEPEPRPEPIGAERRNGADSGTRDGNGTDGGTRDGAPPGRAPNPPVAHRASAESIAARRSPLATAVPAPDARPPIPADSQSRMPAPSVAPLAPVAESAVPPGPAWRLAATAPTEPLDEAAWAVLGALAGVATEAAIVERLGWPEVKAEIILRSLESRGVIVAAAGETPSA